VYIQEFVYIDKLQGRWSNLRRGERMEPDLVQREIWVVSGRFKGHGRFSSQVGIGVMGKGSHSREQFFFRKESGIM
jgi:hypothetical protein